MVEAPPRLPRLEQAQGQEEQRHPLDHDRRRPGEAREERPAGRGERERPEHEGHHPRVVVAAPGEVDRQEGVPADERGRERGPRGEACRQENEHDHRRRAERAVEPRGGIRRVLDRDRVRLGGQREARPVDRGRVVPARAHERERGIPGELARLVQVRVAVVDGRDPRVVPVGVDVGREQHGRSQGENLNRAREADHRLPTGDAAGAGQEQEPGEICGERGRDGDEVEPGPAGIAALVVRGERRGGRVGERDGRRRQGEDERSGDERPAGGAATGRSWWEVAQSSSAVARSSSAEPRPSSSSCPSWASRAAPARRRRRTRR